MFSTCVSLFFSPSLNCLHFAKVTNHTLIFLQCERYLAFDAFLKNVSVDADKIAVIGTGCSIATEAVAEISSFWNITHVSMNKWLLGRGLVHHFVFSFACCLVVLILRAAIV